MFVLMKVVGFTFYFLDKDGPTTPFNSPFAKGDFWLNVKHETLTIGNQAVCYVIHKI